MKLEYCSREFDLDKVRDYRDIINYLENLEPDETLDMQGATPRAPDPERFAPFDFLTGKEKAQVNFATALSKKTLELRKELFPDGSALLDSLIKMLDPERKVDKKPIDIDTWTKYNQLKGIENVVYEYISYALYNRLGFDIFMAYDKDGQISAIKDLREIFQAQ